MEHHHYQNDHKQYVNQNLNDCTSSGLHKLSRSLCLSQTGFVFGRKRHFTAVSSAGLVLMVEVHLPAELVTPKQVKTIVVLQMNIKNFLQTKDKEQQTK